MYSQISTGSPLCAHLIQKRRLFDSGKEVGQICLSCVSHSSYLDPTLPSSVPREEAGSSTLQANTERGRERGETNTAGFGVIHNLSLLLDLRIPEGRRRSSFVSAVTQNLKRLLSLSKLALLQKCKRVILSFFFFFFFTKE